MVEKYPLKNPSQTRRRDTHPSTLAALAALVKLLDLRVGIRELLRDCDVPEGLRLRRAQVGDHVIDRQQWPVRAVDVLEQRLRLHWHHVDQLSKWGPIGHAAPPLLVEREANRPLPT
jgi:hypothetical protein